MKKAKRIVFGIEISAALVLLAMWLYSGVIIFGGGMDPDLLLPAAYVMTGAFIVLVPCLLFQIYVKFDRFYRSENNPDQTEENK